MALQNIRRWGLPAAILGLGTMLAACAAQPAPSAVACGPAPAPYAAPVAYATSPGAIPVAYYAVPQPQAPIADTQFVRAAYQPAVITRPAAQRVAYQPAARRLTVQPKRSVAKSAVIIGSSAGVAAGIGAAIGGKKGAGIGALVGGGGAALWDQLTRRR